MGTVFWFVMGMAYVFIGMLALNCCSARLFAPLDRWIDRSLWRGVAAISGWVVVLPLLWLRHAAR